MSLCIKLSLLGVLALGVKPGAAADTKAVNPCNAFALEDHKCVPLMTEDSKNLGEVCVDIVGDTVTGTITKNGDPEYTLVQTQFCEEALLSGDPGLQFLCRCHFKDLIESKWEFSLYNKCEEGMEEYDLHMMGHAFAKKLGETNTKDAFGMDQVINEPFLSYIHMKIGCRCPPPDDRSGPALPAPPKEPKATPAPSPLPPKPTDAPTTPAPAPVTTKTFTPVTLPQKCLGHVASWSGDPHMKTFDGVSYDCQGEGEFTILKSLNSTFSMQGRFVKFRATARPTVTKSVVFNTGDGEPTIELRVPDTSANGCTPYAYVNGVRRDIATQGIGVDAVQVQGVQSSDGGGFILYYHNSKVQLTALSKTSSTNGCVLATKLCLPFDYDRTAEKFVGLLGTPNKVKSDDWMNKAGKPVAMPTKSKDLRYQPAYDYCVQNWCIRDPKESLFTYEDGESFEKFFKCEQPADVKTEQCATKPPADIARICGTGNEACIIDGCIGGAEDAKKSIEAEDDLKDKMCGKQVYFESFDQLVDGPFGDINRNEVKATNFLHLYKGSATLSKTFEVPAFASIVTVEFLLYEIGGWEHEKSSKDFVYVRIGDTKVDIKPFSKDDKLDDFYHDVQGGISWTRKAITKSGDLGFGFKKDQMHKVLIKVPKERFSGGILDFGVEVVMSGGKNDESAGVDDLRVVAFGDSCESPTDKEGPGAMLAPPKSQAKDLPAVPEVLPVVCDGSSAQAWGDVHVVSWDGVKFDCQGEGEFILAKSLDDSFQVQGRFINVNKKKVTVTRALAVKDKNVPTLQLSVPSSYDLQCPVTLAIDGVERDLLDGSGMDSIVVRQLKDSVVIYYPETQVQLVVKVSKSKTYGCSFSTKVCLPDSYRPEEQIIGLLGTPDEDPANDWVDAQGSALVLPTGSAMKKDAFDYCTDNWCIRDEAKSIFSYGTGESFEGFYKCGDAYDKSADVCAANPPAWALDLCGEENEQCLFEGCVGGEEGAKIAMDVEFDLSKDQRCGEQIYFEDFESFEAALARDVCDSMILNHKCKEGSTRVLENRKTDLAGCQKQCSATEGCEFFSFANEGPNAGVCMGCGSTSDMEPSSGFVFYPVSCKAAAVEKKSAVSLASGPGACPDMFINTKCPYKHEDRLFRIEGQTLEGCQNYCLKTKGCDYYSYGKPEAGQFKGVCMGCTKDVAKEAHTGFDFYSVNCVGKKTVQSFKSGANPLEWGGLVETEPVSGQTFLGRLHKDSPSVSKEFVIPKSTESVTIDFLLYEIDDWSSTAERREKNKFYVTVGNTKVNLDVFEDADNQFDPGNVKSGFKNGIFWERQALTSATNFGFNPDDNDQIHKVTLKIPDKYFRKDNKLKVGFDVELMDTVDNVSAGVDDLRIVANPKRCGDLDRTTPRQNNRKKTHHSNSHSKSTSKDDKSTSKDDKSKSKDDKSKSKDNSDSESDSQDDKKAGTISRNAIEMNGGGNSRSGISRHLRRVEYSF